MYPLFVCIFLKGGHDEFVEKYKSGIYSRPAGEKRAVILSIEDYEQLLEDIHDLTARAERLKKKPSLIAGLWRNSNAMELYQIEWKKFYSCDCFSTSVPFIYLCRTLEINA